MTQAQVAQAVEAADTLKDLSAEVIDLALAEAPDAEEVSDLVGRIKMRAVSSESVEEVVSEVMSEMRARRKDRGARKEMEREMLKELEDMVAPAAMVDLEGKLESLDEVRAIAWIEVGDGLTIKTELPAAYFKGMDMAKGVSFRVAEGTRRAVAREMPVIETPPEMLAEIESLSQAYEKRSGTREWRRRAAGE